MMSLVQYLLPLVSLSATYVLAAENETNVSVVVPPPSITYSLSVETRHNLNKAHAILMVFAWIFFIPSAFLFARMMRDSFANRKPFGLAVWFHVHRTFNYIGIVLMIASFLIIMFSKDWRWLGPGSHASTSKQIHTMTGVLAIVLAVIQPILSFFRCDPSDARRTLFNWTHRIMGILAYLLASVALVISALTFKMWQDKVLQGMLMLAPTAVLILLIAASFYLRPHPDLEKHEARYSVRVSLVSWAIGVFMTISIILTVLIAQGYKK